MSVPARRNLDKNADKPTMRVGRYPCTSSTCPFVMIGDRYGFDHRQTLCPLCGQALRFDGEYLLPRSL